MTMLLKAASKTLIPVSCLEVGRWNNGRRFSSSSPTDHSMRRMVAQHVSQGVIEAGLTAEQRFAADQGAIWHEIRERQSRAEMTSPTSALHDVYRAEQRPMEELVRSFPLPPGSRGVAIGLFDRGVGLDLFDSAETLERQSRRAEAALPMSLDHFLDGASPRRWAVDGGRLRPRGSPP